MNESVLASSDFKLDKNGRKYPAKRIHMGEKEQVQEASYKGNIGVMELAKFHSTASPKDKAHFVDLMNKKSSAKSEHEQQQMASQIWDHVQKVTGVKLHQMENTMLTFREMLESKEDYILQSLADKDINASIKDGKVHIHDHSQHAKAKLMVKKMGMPHEVVKAIKEDFEQLDELSKKSMGGFSYGKPPRKGSSAYYAALKRKEQENKTPVIEPKDQMAGVGKLTKNITEDHTVGDVIHVWRHAIDGKTYHGSTNIDHVTGNYIKARHPVTNETIRFHKKTKAEVGQTPGSRAGSYVFATNKNKNVSESSQSVNFAEVVRGYLNHKNVAQSTGLPCLTLEDYAAQYEEKKIIVPTLKPRDPNHKILAAKKNAAGAHKDKKKEFKMGKGKNRHDSDFM